VDGLAWRGTRRRPAAQSSLDVFDLTPEPPDILKRETARPPPKSTNLQRLAYFKRFVFVSLNRSQSFHTSINRQSDVQLLGSPKQSTEVVDNLVEKDDADREP
jgi:hypothetical protein